MGLEGCGKIGPGWSNFAVGSPAICLRIVFRCGVGWPGMLSIRLLGFAFPVVGVQGMRLLVAVPVLAPVLVFVVGDSPVTSACAGRCFRGSGGWENLKMKDASL